MGDKWISDVSKEIDLKHEYYKFSMKRRIFDAFSLFPVIFLYKRLCEWDMADLLRWSIWAMAVFVKPSFRRKQRRISCWDILNSCANCANVLKKLESSFSMSLWSSSQSSSDMLVSLRPAFWKTIKIFSLKMVESWALFCGFRDIPFFFSLNNVFGKEKVYNKTNSIKRMRWD